MYRYYKYSQAYVAPTADKIAECQARVNNEIARITASSMPDTQKTMMLTKLNDKKARCATDPRPPLTQAEKIAQCQARVTAKIARLNADTLMSAQEKADKLAKLNTKLAACPNRPDPPDGDEDKPHGRPYKQNQVISGKLDTITALLQQILDFLKSVLHLP